MAINAIDYSKIYQPGQTQATGRMSEFYTQGGGTQGGTQAQRFGQGIPSEKVGAQGVGGIAGLGQPADIKSLVSKFDKMDAKALTGANKGTEITAFGRAERTFGGNSIYGVPSEADRASTLQANLSRINGELTPNQSGNYSKLDLFA